jgi:hypothetical protein
MDSVVKLINYPASVRNVITQIQEAQTNMEEALNAPDVQDYSRLAELREAFAARSEAAIESVLEVYRQKEEIREAERTLATKIERASEEAVERAIPLLKKVWWRRVAVCFAIMLGLSALGGYGASYLGFLDGRSAAEARNPPLIPIYPTCITQSDGSKVCTLVIPPPATPGKH